MKMRTSKIEEIYEIINDVNSSTEPKVKQCKLWQECISKHPLTGWVSFWSKYPRQVPLVSLQTWKFEKTKYLNVIKGVWILQKVFSVFPVTCR